MAKLFSFEDQAVANQETESAEVAGLNNDIIDKQMETAMDQIDQGFESIDKLVRMQNIMERSDDNQYATEAFALLMETVGNNLGMSYSKTQASMESIGSNRTLALEGITDTIGIVVKKVIDFIAYLYDKVEILWNHTVRGLSDLKTKVSNIRGVAESIKGSSRKEAMASKKISSTLYTKNGVPLTGAMVKDTIKNHIEVAASAKGFRDALNDMVEYDIDRVQGLFQRAKNGDKLNKDDVFGGTVEKMKRLIKLANENGKIVLGEGHSIMLEIDREALDSYAFSRCSLQMTMVNNISLVRADQMVTASKAEGIEIAKSLENLLLQMTSMTDFYQHFSHTYSKQIKNDLTSILTGILGVILGPIGLPFTIISIVTWVKTIYYFVVNVCKFFATKFSNVTFRTMEGSLAYIHASAH